MHSCFGKLSIILSVIVLTLVGSVLIPLQNPTHVFAAASDSLTFPVRGMFYYPWFSETWGSGDSFPFTHYHPVLGFYNSSDAATISKHIQAMQYGGAQVGIFEWSGQGTLIDQRVPLLLKAANGTGFHWAVYYNQEGLSIGHGPNPSPAQIADDLSYINRMYAGDASYAKINGRPLVFVYANGEDDCGMADRWHEGNAGINDYIVLKVFPGYEKCTNQPDGWHQYGPDAREDGQGKYSFTVSPGFWKSGEGSPRLSRDANQFAQDVRDMVNSHAQFQLITTFNEWGEGTAVEDASEWNSGSGFGSYLDILHNTPTR
jgi:hypothetical protein